MNSEEFRQRAALALCVDDGYDGAGWEKLVIHDAELLTAAMFPEPVAPAVPPEAEAVVREWEHWRNSDCNESIDPIDDAVAAYRARFPKGGAK